MRNLPIRKELRGLSKEVYSQVIEAIQVMGPRTFQDRLNRRSEVSFLHKVENVFQLFTTSSPPVTSRKRTAGARYSPTETDENEEPRNGTPKRKFNVKSTVQEDVQMLHVEPKKASFFPQLSFQEPLQHEESFDLTPGDGVTTDDAVSEIVTLDDASPKITLEEAAAKIRKRLVEQCRQEMWDFPLVTVYLIQGEEPQSRYWRLLRIVRAKYARCQGAGQSFEGSFRVLKKLTA